jgi:small subunit ribosomal protein S19
MLKRSIWKGPFIDVSLFSQTTSQKKKIFKTTSRNSVVLPFLIGQTIQIHNGKFFIPIFIREDMVGHRLGEFVPTRLRHIYKKKKKNGSKIKSK